MISLEDRLRIALRDTAAEVPAGAVHPLDLRAGVHPNSRRALRLTTRTLTGLSAAAAVAGVVLVSAALASGSHAQHTAHSARPPAKPGPAQSAAKPQPLPPYFLVLTGTGDPYYDNPLHAAIRATVSGQTVAVLTPPAPYGTFIGISAAADDRTFVLAARVWQPGNTSYAVGINSGPVAFFLLRFNPGDAQPALTRLPIPEIPASEQVGGLALAPDGSQLAVATDAGSDSQQLTIYAIATGAARTWTAHVTNGWLGGNGPGAQNMVDPHALSWTADGSTLAYGDLSGPVAVELLKLAGTSDSLLADSRRVVPQTPRGCVGDAMITPDGSAFACAVAIVDVPAPAGSTPPPAGQPTSSVQPSALPWAPQPSTITIQVGFAEFSTRSGALLRTLDEQSEASTNGFTQQVLWSSPSGDELITESALPYLNRISVLTVGSLTLLPLADQSEIPAVVW